MKINYDHYRFSLQEFFRYLMEGIGLTLFINYICYQTLWAFLVLIPVPVIYIRWKKKMLIKKRRDLLGRQFKDAVHGLSVALNAGYSMENALAECLRDLRNIYKEGSPVVQEFLYMQYQMKVSVPVEQLFLDLGNRCRIEDVQNFASVYAISKRSGGNLSMILQKASRMIEEKIEVEQEIEVSVAAKRMEQSLMCMIPCGIILYMQLASPGFLNSLYKNPVGIAVMSVCLFLYLGAFRMGRKIIEIEV